MKINKLKILSIAICCLINVLLSESQCCEDLKSRENKWVTIISKDSNKALDSWGNNDQVGKYTPHSPYHEHYNRHLWMIQPMGDNYYRIISKDSNKALDSWGNNDQVGKYTPHSSYHEHYNRHLWRFITPL